MTPGTRWWTALLLLTYFTMAPLTSAAHGLNVGQLELEQIGVSRYFVAARFPAFSEPPEQLVRIPENCHPMDPQNNVPAGFLVLDGVIVCEPGVPLVINFPWPNSTVLAYFKRADGTQSERLIQSGPAGMTVRFDVGETNPRDVAGTSFLYGRLGLEHILSGWDHLLFIACLLVLTAGWRQIAVTITSFTVAHSLTLALSILGHARLPSATVELVIAMSVMFLAAEFLRRGNGGLTLTRRAPWLAAFGFGLLHGLGFAGALEEIGLPAQQVPLALLSFNIGVEIGQLAFASLLLVLTRLAGHLGPAAPRRFEFAITLVSGVVASFWVIQRTYLLLTGPV